MESKLEQFDVAIVGGGLAGLCVGHELSKRSPDTRWALFESSDRLGGKVLTERIEYEDGEFIVEAGPDAFLDQKPWARELAEELGLGDQLVPINETPNPVSILRNGTPINLPEGVALIAPTKIGPFLRTPLLSPFGKARAGLDLILPAKRDTADESVGAFIRRRLGQEALDWLAEPMVAGIYNADPDELSLQATFPHFRAMEREHGSVIRGLRASRAKSAEAPRSPAFLTLRNGMQELVDTHIDRLDHRLRTGAEVRSIHRLPDGRLALRTDSGEIAATSVVIVTSASNAATLVEGIEPIAAKRLRQLRTAAAGSISLAIRTAEIRRPLNGYGLVVPKREGLPINAITVASEKFPGRAPQGWTLFRVFFGGARSPGTMELDDEQLLKLVREQLSILLGIEASPAFHRIYRWPAGSPQYDVGHLDRVAGIEAALPSGVTVVGSPYRGVGIPDIVRAARETAETVLSRRLAMRELSHA
jgi:oxygen-dependent protoporphyrinogen oxidase